MYMKAKITDVAQKANVSISTVSHVLNHTRFVSEETRKKVMDAVEELGYSPDASGFGGRRWDCNCFYIRRF